MGWVTIFLQRDLQSPGTRDSISWMPAWHGCLAPAIRHLTSSVRNRITEGQPDPLNPTGRSRLQLCFLANARARKLFDIRQSKDRFFV
jgi:hypothetical protein